MAAQASADAADVTATDSFSSRIDSGGSGLPCASLRLRCWATSAAYFCENAKSASAWASPRSTHFETTCSVARLAARVATADLWLSQARARSAHLWALLQAMKFPPAWLAPSLHEDCR